MMINKTLLLEALKARKQEFAMAADYNLAMRIVEEAGPEIIRCKDCVWAAWYTTDNGTKIAHCTETGGSGWEEDDFCSRAERKYNG